VIQNFAVQLRLAAIVAMKASKHLSAHRITHAQGQLAQFRASCGKRCVANPTLLQTVFDFPQKTVIFHQEAILQVRQAADFSS